MPAGRDTDTAALEQQVHDTGVHCRIVYVDTTTTEVIKYSVSTACSTKKRATGPPQPLVSRKTSRA